MKNIIITEKKKISPLSQYLLLESLKIDVETTKHVQCLHDAADAFRNILYSYLSDNSNNNSPNGSSNNGSNNSNEYNNDHNLLTMIYNNNNNDHNSNNSSPERSINSSNNKEFFQNPEVIKFRLQTGLILREMMTNTVYGTSSAAQLWRPAILLACAEDIANYNIYKTYIDNEIKGNKRAITTTGGSNNNNNIEREVCVDVEALLEQYKPNPNQDLTISPRIIEIIDNYSLLQKSIELLDLDNIIWNLKPLLKGKEIIERFCIPNGPLIGKIMNEQVVWQLCYPYGDPNDCFEHLKQFANDLLLHDTSALTSTSTTNNRKVKGKK